MNINISQALQLKQTLKLNQVMIQRFNVLQQTSHDFETMIQDESNKNPFIQFQKISNSQSFGQTGDDAISAVDFATYNESLLSVLTKQLDTQHLTEQDYDIVLTLIDACDDQGFIKNYKSVREDIKSTHGIDDRDVFRCLKILQSFEPDGVGARTLNECLWIQIDHYDLEDETDVEQLKYLVKHHLDDISKKNYQLIIKSLKISKEKLTDYIEFISHLNPNPAINFSQSTTQLVQPSLRIDVKDGVLHLTNLEEERVSVSLNNSLLSEFEKSPTKEAEQQLYQAKIWVEHFKKRQQLLKHCGDYLMKKQRLYFLNGDEFILPCLQKDMAKDLNVSESTISRLVRSKYILFKDQLVLIQSLCQRNIYGKTKKQVKSLIHYYCQRYPNLSDQKLSEILKSIGLPIARRTVTKYRHEVMLKSSYQRQANPK